PDESNEHEKYEPGEDAEIMNGYDGYFYQNSAWNFKLAQVLQQVAASDKRSDEIDASPIFDQMKAKGGEEAAAIIDKIKDLRYAVSDEGDVVISGKLENIVPVLMDNQADAIIAEIESKKAEVKADVREQMEAYGIFSEEEILEKLAEVDEKFPDTDVIKEKLNLIDISCTFKATIKGSDLNNGTVMNAEFVLTNTGSKNKNKQYKGTDAVNWIRDSFDGLVEGIESAFTELEEMEEVNADDIGDKITDAVSPYLEKLDKIEELEEKFFGYSTKEYTFKKTAQAIEAAYNFADKKKNTIKNILDKAENLTHKDLPDELPRYSSVSEILANSKAVKVFSKALDNINSTVAGITSFDVSPEAFGKFADGAYDIKVSLVNGIAKLSAKFPDAEVEEVSKYIEKEYGVDVIEKGVYKKVDIEANVYTMQGSEGGTASVQVDFQRIVPYVTTTVVTTTSTTTNVSTTSTTTDVSTTTSTTSENVDGETTTTTTTTTDGDVAGETTTTTTDGDVAGETTTTTTDGDVSGETTTTTTSDGPSVPGTTTAVVSDVVNVFLDADAGFYLNIDTEFHTEQVKSLTYRIDHATVYMDENGEIVDEDIITKGTPVDITNSFSIKNTPAGVYNTALENGAKQFVHNVPLYATKDIIDEATGTVIATANQQIRYFNGAPVGITAYVGVKGDADFDLKADSTDASAVLVWYALASTSGGNPEKLENAQFSSANLVKDDPLMDDFAAFLCDVDNENSADNWRAKKKPARKVDSGDASFILVYYGKVSTGTDPGRDTWNDVLGDWGKY
ncbi:MAG: hypothetical protein K2N49_00815, partial [Ruminococcus sp.]|nr:hypothetical protein [Ruminococcus sp.]